MDLSQTMKAVSNNVALKFWLTILGIFVVITVGGYFIGKAISASYKLATPDNIAAIKARQNAALETRWLNQSSKFGLTQATQGRFANGAYIMNQGPPADQQLLINFNVQSTRLTGYLGPYDSGVFDEDSATRYALASGSRCLVLEIDKGEYDEPRLIYRDSYGYKQSLNAGSINAVAKSIHGRAFTVANDSVGVNQASDPLILVLYFMSAPDVATKPRDYLRFLGKVAEQLAPIKGDILAQTPQGDFRRQAQESQLFFQPLSVLSKRIICLTNAETSGFRRLSALGLAGELGANQDLDLFVHARLYSKEEKSGLGISSQPSTNINPAAIITTPNYWLNTPPDRLAEAQSSTQRAWTLVLAPSADAKPLTPEQLKKLLTTYGVHSVPYSLFDTPAVTDVYVGRDAPFKPTAWNIKPELIRFIPPKPIVITKPNPSMNSNGGAITAPTF